MRRWSGKLQLGPLSGSPGSIKRRMQGGLILPARNMLCQACEQGKRDVEAENSDVDSEELGEQLRAQHHAVQREVEAMEKLDCDVLVAEIHRPRDKEIVTFYKGMDAGSFRRAFARRKRIAQDSHVMMEAIDDQRQLDSDARLYYAPRKAHRGGAREILVFGMWEARPLFVMEDQVVADILREHAWEGMAFWWGHHKLHRAVPIAEIRTPVVLHLTEDDGTPATFRPRHLCRFSQIISLAELTVWYFLPGDLQQGWPADDWMETAERSETLETAIIAHHHRLARRAFSRARGNPLAVRGGAPKGKGHVAWESSHTLRGATLVTQVQSGDAKLGQIATEQVCADATGAVLCLMRTWLSSFQESYKGPLAFVFPGRCAASLRRHGANVSHIQELEAVIEIGETKEQQLKPITVLSAAGQEISVGKTSRR